MSADDVILGQVNLLHTQRRQLLAAIARRHESKAVDLKAAGNDTTMRRLRKDIEQTLALLGKLAKHSMDAAVRDWADRLPTAATLHNHELPNQVGSLVFVAQPKALDRALTFHQEVKRFSEQLVKLGAEVAKACNHVENIVEGLKRQLSSLTASTPDLLAGSGVSGIVVAGGASPAPSPISPVRSTSATGSLPIIGSHTLTGLAAARQAWFAHGMAHDVYRGLQHFGALREQLERARDGISMLAVPGSGAFFTDKQNRIALHSFSGRLLSGKWTAQQWSDASTYEGQPRFWQKQAAVADAGHGSGTEEDSDRVSTNSSETDSGGSESESSASSAPSTVSSTYDSDSD